MRPLVLSEPRALTLTQPWATLVALGAKRIETRSWGTSYRGPLLIHAAKGFPAGARELCSSPLWSTSLGGLRWSQLPTGAVVAVATLAAVISTDDSRVRFRFQLKHEYPPTERTADELDAEFGDFSPGRFAWFLSDVRALPEPIPARGMLQLWTPPEPVARAIREALGKEEEFDV